jgi:hypothetical protein
MNSKAFTRKALFLCLSGLLTLTLSSFVLAATGKAIGEINISKVSNGEVPQVKVNGELAQSGNTVFSTNTITTPENAGATVRFGKFGSVEIAPNSIVSFNSSDNGLVGEIKAGQITAFSEAISIKALDGKTITPKFGESVNANGVASDDKDYKDCSKDVDNDGDKDCVCIDADGDGVLECDNGGAGWWAWALIFGGAAVGILVATLSNNNRVALGGGSVVTSPTR